MDASKEEIDKGRRERRVLELTGDTPYHEPVLFLRKPDGSLYIHIDGGDGGDTDMGFYSIEADRTLSPAEVEKLATFLSQNKKPGS